VEVMQHWNRCPERPWSLHPWRLSKLEWTDHRPSRSNLEARSASSARVK